MKSWQSSHANNKVMQTPATLPRRTRHLSAPYVVRSSPIHGSGVFAQRKILAGTRIIEYKGERITWTQAIKRAAASGFPINHTYFFTLNDGHIIDGASHGNVARFINHSCEPNCEPLEHADGRVYLYSLRDIERGEELTYHYALIYDARHTKAVKQSFPCHCGSLLCTGTMLASKAKRRIAKEG